jgi:peptide deformylase
MTIKTVLRMGEPSLLQRSEPVTEFGTPELQQLVSDMWETMHAENGAGLAAPQIGVNLRLVVFGFEYNQRYPEAPQIPSTVLINPEIEFLSDDTDEQYEGCLSVPGLRAMVPRYTHIHYRGFDENGHEISREVKGFHARVVQHECDHLDGILYPQRIANMQSLGFREELENNGLIDLQPCDD